MDSIHARLSPGEVRDAIMGVMDATAALPLAEIERRVEDRLGAVRSSSIRSYLNLNTPELFERPARGFYRLRPPQQRNDRLKQISPALTSGKSVLYEGDCFETLANLPRHSIHAVVTDPPYGLVEYSPAEVEKLRAGKGGVWRIPPSFDGSKRAPLPRFTALKPHELIAIEHFFYRFGLALKPVLLPGAHVLIASNPLVYHHVTSAMEYAGFEARGAIARLVMTMRGGDRPKNAHEEFSGVTVMPRSMWEPWVIMRLPSGGRVQDSLRQSGTGGFRRVSDDRPFGDVIQSSPTRPKERAIANHPSLKPQAFLRQVVRGVLPLGTGVVLDPFAGSGSTLAAANAVGYSSIGIERDKTYVAMARNAIPALASLR